MKREWNNVLVHIPMQTIDEALKLASDHREVETAGFFCTIPATIHIQGEGRKDTFEVVYYAMENKSVHPGNEMEISAAQMAEMIVDNGYYPIAFFHSHPSGTFEPSAFDLAFFPATYVDHGFIWCGSDQLVHYDGAGINGLVNKSEVFINVG
jgi:proteasome lid subunit RPN8/RPN11